MIDTEFTNFSVLTTEHKELSPEMCVKHSFLCTGFIFHVTFIDYCDLIHSGGSQAHMPCFTVLESSSSTTM